jgi:hypothetical protein
MALAGPTLSERDRAEFRLMGAEKTAAFAASWNAMALQAFRAQQALWLSFARSLWSLWLGGRALPKLTPQLRNAVLVFSTKALVRCTERPPPTRGV